MVNHTINISEPAPTIDVIKEETNHGLITMEHVNESVMSELR